MLKNTIILIFLLIHQTTFSQTAKKRLPGQVNIPNQFQYAPCISGDGRSLLFMSDYSIDRKLGMQYSYMVGPGKWKKAEELIFKTNYTHLHYLGGYSLSYDGKMLFFTSRKSPGVGGYDVWYSEKSGDKWGAPINVGAPVNSKSNEGCPSLSPDGKYLYYMRCESMSEKIAKGCKLMVAERKNKEYWKEPVELPAPINTSHETTPRIMPDNETLIFASERPGGKGGLDLYLTRKKDGRWTTPIPMDFINTGEDDQFVSVPAKGNFIYFAGKYKKYNNIFKTKIPRELQPKKVILVKGKVTDEATRKPLDAVIQVFALKSGKKTQYKRTDMRDGSFFLLLTEGEVYDFSIYPVDKKHTFHSRLFDLDPLEKYRKEVLKISLSSLKPGTTFVLNNIRYKRYSEKLKDESNMEMKRLARLLKSNSALSIEVGGFTDKVIKDSVQSSPDLTEVIIDTTYHLNIDTIYETFLDTVYEGNLDSASVEFIDEMFDNENYIIKDSLVLVEDSVIVSIDSIETYTINYTWHNDRTTKQAQTIVDLLIGKGIPQYRLVAKGYGDERLLVPNNSPEDREKNRRIEVKIIK